MRTRSKIAAVALIAAAGVSTGGAAIAGGSDDADENITGPAADAAKAAALVATGGGTVDAVERDDEANGAIWEVEVTKPDGTMMEISVDGKNKVVDTEAGDSDTENESETDDGE